MGYGKIMSDKPTYGKKDINKPSNTEQNIEQKIGSYDNYIDQDNLNLEYTLAKLENEIKSGELEYKILEKETEEYQEKYQETMNKIIEAEREKLEIIEDSEILEEIYDRTKDLGIFSPSVTRSSERYLLSGERNARLGIIKNTSDVDEFEVEQMYKNSREYEGQVAYNKKRMKDLKNELEKKKQQYKSGQEISPIGDDIDTWSGF